MISLSITSSKRPELFKRTFKSLCDKCLDLSLVDEIIFVDDHSSEDQYKQMLEVIFDYYPYLDATELKIRWRTDGKRGLGYSLNTILDEISNEYCLHIEDDWEFIKEGSFITQALNILKSNDKLFQVLFKDRSMFNKFKGINNTEYYLWETGIANDGQQVEHAGFTLNPSLIKWKWIKETYGYFNHTNIEGTFSDRLYSAGFRTATTTSDYIKHIGTEISSFALNQTPR